MPKSGIAKTLKFLRAEQNITQKQLAKETGLSLSSIISYENGLREPNSKAMSVLEKYFNVSGEFLRGELQKDSFKKKADEISDNFDELLLILKDVMDDVKLASQEKQNYYSELSIVFYKYLAEIIKDNSDIPISVTTFSDILEVCKLLNSEGQEVMVSRAEELTYIEKYKSVNENE